MAAGVTKRLFTEPIMGLREPTPLTIVTLP